MFKLSIINKSTQNFLDSHLICKKTHTQKYKSLQGHDIISPTAPHKAFGFGPALNWPTRPTLGPSVAIFQQSMFD